MKPQFDVIYCLEFRVTFLLRDFVRLGLRLGCVLASLTPPGQPLPQQNVLGGEAFCSVATARFLSLRQERGGGGSAPWEQTGSCLNPEVVFLDFVGFFFFFIFLPRHGNLRTRERFEGFSFGSLCMRLAGLQLSGAPPALGVHMMVSFAPFRHPGLL